MTNSNLIGQIIISSTLGVGRVVGIDQIGDDKRYFLVVESVDKKLKNFIPVDDERSYRTLSEKEEITKVIEGLSSPIDSTEHDSKKDRINYFKENSQFQDIETISKLIRELNILTDRGSVEDQIFKRLTKSLADEHSMVHQVTEAESTTFVMDSLKK
jgi:RNA polymerase-interacting CarD/CdnL/TRCF family regulator